MEALVYAGIGISLIGLAFGLLIRTASKKAPPRTPTKLDNRNRPYDRWMDGGWK